MSISLISRVFEHSRTSGSERLVLLALAFCCNSKRDDNRAWPSLDALAVMVNMTRSALCKVLRNLEASGEVKRQRSNGGRNNEAVTKFALQIVSHGTQFPMI